MTEELLFTIVSRSQLCIPGIPTYAPPPPGHLPPRHLPPRHLPPRHLSPTFAPPPGHIPPLDICPSAPEKNNKQRLRFNNITSIVIKSIYKDVKDEM